MRMVMIIVESRYKERVEAALAAQQIEGYTEVPTVYGRGRSGMRLGSRAFPETSSLLFTVVESEQVDGLLQALDAACPDCRPALRTIVWAVERLA